MKEQSSSIEFESHYDVKGGHAALFRLSPSGHRLRAEKYRDIIFVQWGTDEALTGHLASALGQLATDATSTYVGSDRAGTVHQTKARGRALEAEFATQGAEVNFVRVQRDRDNIVWYWKPGSKEAELSITAATWPQVRDLAEVLGNPELALQLGIVAHDLN